MKVGAVSSRPRELGGLYRRRAPIRRSSKPVIRASSALSARVTRRITFRIARLMARRSLGAAHNPAA